MADVSMISGVLFLIIKSTLCSKKVWSEIPTIRNHLPKSSFNVTTTRSSLECAEYSQQMDSCLAFAYNKVTQTCSPLDDLRQRQYEESTYVWYLYVTDCDTGWKQSEEFCYLVVDIPKTWQDASKYA
ncbi:uncharacterized protein LOC117322672 [Pecten maximus]|uniref:uncharacterized protein LOC117322672 n=1 Tax=Pecten maximus TaxID=6579 RepID=UPI001458AC6C|nr:uncharacterized protein LOC117322672 [Pecten maximus]